MGGYRGLLKAPSGRNSSGIELTESSFFLSLRLNGLNRIVAVAMTYCGGLWEGCQFAMAQTSEQA